MSEEGTAAEGGRSCGSASALNSLKHSTWIGLGADAALHGIALQWDLVMPSRRWQHSKR